MKNLQMQLEQIREDTAECLLNSKLAANGKPELFATLPENLDALALHVEETISANDERMARSRRVLLWSLAIVLTTIAGAAFFWASNDIEKDSSPVAIAQSRPEPSPAPRTDGEAAIGLPISIYQEDRKILTEQLSALAARVETLERTLGNLEKARSEIAGPSNKQSVGSEQDPPAAGTKPSTLVERPVPTEEKRTTLEKPVAAPPGTGNPVTESVEQVEAIPVPNQAELNLRKRAIGPPGCTHFRSFDPISGTYTSFNGRRRQCR
jgi:hypothetical protein